MPARRSHPSDRVVCTLRASMHVTGYVIRSTHWDTYRAEVWVHGDLVFQADRKTKRGAEALADAEVEAALLLA